MAAGQIRLGAGTPPAASPGEGTLYFDSSDDQLYVIDSAGATVGPITGGGGGGNATQLQSEPISATTPNNYEVLTYNAGTAQWEPLNRDVGPATALYMATNGSDATGRRGDPSRPYLTLQAALNNAVDGDTIYIGPGTFEVNATPGTPFQWPLGVQSLSIIGSGMVTDAFILTPPKAGTLIQDLVRSGAGSSLIDLRWSALSGVPIEGFRLENLSLCAPSVTQTIIAADTNGPSGDYMLGDGLVLRNVGVYNSGISGLALNMIAANNYTLENVDFTLKDVRLANCRQNTSTPVRNLRARQLQLRSDNGAPGAPTLGLNQQKFQSCSFSDNVFLGGQADVFFDKNCVVLGDVTSSPSLLISGLLNVNVASVPNIRFHGSANNVLFAGATPIPDSLSFDMALDFTDARITSVIAFGGASPTMYRQRVKGDNVIAAQVGIEDAIDYYDRFMDLSQGNVVTTGFNGTVNPRTWSYSTIISGGAGTTVSYANVGSSTNVTTGTAPIAVHVTPFNTVVAPLAIFPATTTDVTVLSGGAGATTAYITAFWNDTY